MFFRYIHQPPAALHSDTISDALPGAPRPPPAGGGFAPSRKPNKSTTTTSGAAWEQADPPRPPTSSSSSLPTWPPVAARLRGPRCTSASRLAFSSAEINERASELQKEGLLLLLLLLLPPRFLEKSRGGSSHYLGRAVGGTSLQKSRIPSTFLRLYNYGPADFH